MELNNTSSDSDKDRAMKARSSFEAPPPPPEKKSDDDEDEKKRFNIFEIFEKSREDRKAEETADKDEPSKEAPKEEAAPTEIELPSEDEESSPETLEEDEISPELAEAEISAEEMPVIAKAMIEAEEEANQPELSNPETEIPARAVEKFLQEIQESIDSGEPLTVEMVVGKAGEVTTLIETVPGSDSFEANMNQPSEPEEDEPAPANPTASTSTRNTTPTTAPATPAGGAGAVPPFVPGGGGGGGRGRGGGPGLPPLGMPGGSPGGPSSPNVMVTPGMAASSPESWRPNRRRAGELLLVGIVGYLIGRRRGRLNTEAKMKPVQEKLEKQVKELYDEITYHEDKIRELAAEKVKTEPEAKAALIERLAEKRSKKVEDKLPEHMVPRPESIGRLLIPKMEALTSTETAQKSVETMTMPELLEIAARIEKDGITLKEMYAAGRLDAVGLRRVIHEYLRGDRFNQVLRENLRNLESWEHLNPSSQQTTVAGMSASAGAAPGFEQSAQPSNGDYRYANNTSTAYTNKSTGIKDQIKNNQGAVITGIVGGVIILVLIILFG